MLNIPYIMLHTLLHILDSLGLTTAPVHLCPSRDTRSAKMSHHIVSYQLRVHLGVIEHVRTRSYQTHVTLEYIDKLWKLVDGTLSEEITKLCFSRVILGSLHLVGIRVHLHRAELRHLEALSVISRPLLPEIERSLAARKDVA